MQSGDACWVPEPSHEGFVQATVTSVRADSLTVKDGGGREQKLPADDVYPVNPANQAGCKDNTELMYLREPHMLHNLSLIIMVPAPFLYAMFSVIMSSTFPSLPLCHLWPDAGHAGEAR